MFICIYEKSNRIVHQLRNDSSVPQVIPAEKHLRSFCEDNEVPVDDYAVAEIPYQKVEFFVGKFIYDAQTASMIISPDWREPPAIETSNIPVSDPGAAQ